MGIFISNIIIIGILICVITLLKKMKKSDIIHQDSISNLMKEINRHTEKIKELEAQNELEKFRKEKMEE